MKVCIHAVGISMGGGAQHLRCLLEELGKTPDRFEFHVLVRDSALVDSASSSVRVHVVPRWISRLAAARFFYDQVVVPFFLVRGRFQMLVALANFGPLFSPVPQIVFQRNALYFAQGAGNTSGWRYRLRLTLLGWLCRRARRVVTPSESMKSLLVNALPWLPPSKISVLLHGFDKMEKTSASAKLAFAGIKILYVSHYAKHKGFEFLLEALHLLKKNRTDFRVFLTLGGALEKTAVDALTRRAESLGVKDNLVFLGQVPSSETASLYCAADFSVFPSHCESFGFPLLESIGYGLPVVASNAAFCQEISGEGALYYPEGNLGEAARILESAFDPKVREGLRAKAAERMQEVDWRWARYAREFKALLTP